MQTKRNTSIEPVAFSVGGSIVNPGQIDVVLLRKLKSVLLGAARTRRVGVVVGGGYPSRQYIDAAKKLGVRNVDAHHWIGIRGTHMNAQLVQAVLDPKHLVIVDEYASVKPQGRIIVGGGEEPGHSTDYDTVLLAEKLKAKVIYNLSNIDYVYDKDPRKFKNAKPLKDFTWAAYVRRFPLKFRPGMHLPFDPHAVRRARANGMIVIILNGRNIPNLKKAISGKPFRGTVVHP